MKSANQSPLNLAFIDPGRRKAPFFLELRRYLEPGAHCVYYSRRIMVRGFVRSVDAPLSASGWQASAPFEISDEELQNAIGRKEWIKRGPKALLRARRLLRDLSSFYDAQDVGAILVWNGSNLIVALAVYLARRRGLPVIFAEHGYLPGTTQLDLRGVNFDSTATGLIASGEGLLPPDPALDHTLDQEIAAYKSGQPMRVLSPKVPRHFRADLRSSLYCRLALWIESRFLKLAPAVGQDHAELPQRFVFLPLQVQKDSQLILHSPLVGNDMSRLLGLLHAALREVDPGMRIVVKLHPRERWDRQSRYADLIREYPDVLFIRHHRMAELLEKAAAVVTVNSTVGFEAFLYDKPVIALGHNFYTAPGLVERVDRADQLPAALLRALTQPVDVERRRAMLRFVIDGLLAFGSYHDFSERSLRAVADRILSLLALPEQSRFAAADLVSVADEPLRPSFVFPSDGVAA